MTLEILVNTTLRMLVICAVAWLALRLLRVRNPHVEALVWRMLLLAGLALPALLYWRLAPSFVSSFELPETVAGGRGAAGVSADFGPAWASAGALVTVYLAVALLLLGRLATGLVGMWGVRRAAQPLATIDDVRVSARVRSPATFGTTVLLPADARAWPEDKLGAVLAHERAHVRSRDGYWSWLAQLHAAIFWFNPLAWWLRGRLELLAETTSDDAVVVENHDPVAYAEMLLEFARHSNRRSVAMSVAESNVSERIERLLARTPPSAALARAARWTAFAALIPAVVFAASTTRAAPPSEPPAAPVPAAQARPVLPASVSIAGAADPDIYYPAVAKHEKVSGYAVVEVDLDVLGQVVDARVLDVQPADPRYGFADAALQVAWKSSFRNSTQQVASMKFKVKFELTE